MKIRRARTSPERTFSSAIEAELKRYRAAPWMESGFKGILAIGEILRSEAAALWKDQLLEALGIDRRETDLIKALNSQIGALEGFGMVRAERGILQWIA